VTSEFFSATAQIVPILLLALAIDARFFASVPRARHGDVAAQRIEMVHRLLEGATVLVLLAAEIQSLADLRNADGGDPWLTVSGISWGFAAIAAIAFRGTGRARVNASLEIAGEVDIAGESQPGIILRLGASNEFGDRELEPLLNTLIGPGVDVYDWNHAEQKVGKKYEFPLSAPVVIDGKTVECLYADQRVALSAGDVAVSHVLLRMRADEVLVVMRLDHVEFMGGRVERAAFVRRGPSLELIDELTA
jgi:hypothetical protein